MSKVLEIYIAESGASNPKKIEVAELVSGRGVIGDRYFNETGTFSEKLAGLPDKELTLIESEEIDIFNKEFNFNFSYGDFRRNIVTTGVKLNDLEGKEFMLGSVRLLGVRLCEPCAHLANLLVPEIMPSLVHKTGLRAQIITSGSVSVGNNITA